MAPAAPRPKSVIFACPLTVATTSVERTSVMVSTASAVLLLRLTPPSTAPTLPPTNLPGPPPNCLAPEFAFWLTMSGTSA